MKRDGARDERVTLVNETSQIMPVWLEPWGDCLSLEPGEALTVTATGPHGDALELLIGADKWQIFAWSGSVLEVHAQGERIWGTKIPAP